MSKRGKSMDSNSIIHNPGFNVILHDIRGNLVAPYVLFPYMMLTAVIYTYKGELMNIEITNIPEGTLDPDVT
jgi:hypothetical protein